MVETLCTFVFLNCEKKTGLGYGYPHIWHEESSNTTLNASIRKIVPGMVVRFLIYLEN